MITPLEPDILKCKVKWVLGSITTNKASGGDGIPVELFQILKDDAVKVLHSICQQICGHRTGKGQFSFQSQRKAMPRKFKLLLSHTSRVMLKILQAMLQRYMDCELLDVEVGSRKGRRTRDQIFSICWIIKKAREFQKNIYFCFIDYAKAFDSVDHNKLENSSRNENTRLPYLLLEKSVCR